MNRLATHIDNAKTMADLDVLRPAIVQDKENFLENQKLFIKQKNKIKRHGGKIK